MTAKTDTRFKQVDRTMRKLGYERSALIESLHTAQEVFGYLEKEVLRFIAQRLSLPYSKVYGVATFYHFFRLKPQGKHVCVLCTGTACYIKGADKILAALERRFGVKAGEATEDGELSILSARCFGSCSLAPVAVFDKQTIGHLDEAATVEACERMCDDSER